MADRPTRKKARRLRQMVGEETKPGVERDQGYGRERGAGRAGVEVRQEVEGWVAGSISSMAAIAAPAGSSTYNVSGRGTRSALHDTDPARAPRRHHQLLLPACGRRIWSESPLANDCPRHRAISPRRCSNSPLISDRESSLANRALSPHSLENLVPYREATTSKTSDPGANSKARSFQLLSISLAHRLASSA